MVEPAWDKLFIAGEPVTKLFIAAFAPPTARCPTPHQRLRWGRDSDSYIIVVAARKLHLGDRRVVPLFILQQRLGLFGVCESGDGFVGQFVDPGVRERQARCDAGSVAMQFFRVAM